MHINLQPSTCGASGRPMPARKHFQVSNKGIGSRVYNESGGTENPFQHCTPHAGWHSTMHMQTSN